MMAIIAAIVAVLFLSAVSVKAYIAGGDACRVQQAKAEKLIADKEMQLADLQKLREADAADTLAKMSEVYEIGKEQAKTKYITIREQGAKNVSIYPVLVNRSCDWPDELVHDVQRAFAAVQSPADTGQPAAGVPQGTAPSGGTTGPNLPVDAGNTGAGGGVPKAPATVGSGGQISGNGVQAGQPPKPKPTGKQQ